MFAPQAYADAKHCRLQSFGRENPETIFYVIFRSASGGFFSNLFHVLGHLYHAEKFGLIPVIDMENFPVFYNEETQIEGTQNSWEYYFFQPSPYRLEEVYKSKKVLFSDGQYCVDVDGHSTFLPIYLKYIRIKPYILEEIEVYRKKYFEGKSILGVHFRGQEMNRTPNHPYGPTARQMIQAAEKLLMKYPIDNIFLVTEEQSYLDVFIREFGTKVLFRDSFRTRGINAYTIRPYPRPNHMYLLGLEILKDALALSSADFLLAGGRDGVASGSNVSQAAQMINDGHYKHVETIFNGTNPPPLKERYPFLYRCYRAAQYIFQNRELG